MTPPRWRTRALALLAVVPVLLGVSSAIPASAAIQGDVTINGHGWGHGRGLSQYGSLGYAVDHGWDYTQILDHYYGGTVMGAAANDPITVELLSHRGTTPAITGIDLRVDGVPVNAAALRVRRQAPGQFAIDTGPGCAGPWTSWSGAMGPGFQIYSTAPQSAAGVVKTCDPGLARGYRGSFLVFEGAGFLALVNKLPIEEYLLGVVPRESPASWGSAGGGKGMNALRAQSVAARSYALAGGWTGYAKTCDTTSCQVYMGTNTMAPDGSFTTMEHPNTNQAVTDTAGQVRRKGGAIVRAEFSSSTGGWTAGGDFPAVEDLGDATASNPNFNWTATIDAGVLAQRLGTAPITGITITERNGLGAEGGRVRRVVVDTNSGPVVLTGNEFRIRAQLKSDWFSISYNGVSYAQAASFVRALYNDVLKRTAGGPEVAGWAQRVAAGLDRAVVAREFVTSAERLQRLVDEAYQGALQRRPDSGGYTTWVNYLRSGATLNDLNASVYGSYESFLVLGGGDYGRWVDGMYLGILGRSADPGERSFWTNVAATKGTASVAWQISASVEGRQRRLNGYYVELLQRGVDGSGLQTWMPRMVGRGDFDVPAFIASSYEYWLRAPVRFP